jgi:hypothetical protein
MAIMRISRVKNDGRIEFRKAQFLRWLLLVIVAVWAAGVSPALSDEPEAGEPGSKWVRVLRDDDGNVTAMQTAIVRYVPADAKPAEGQPTYVDLVGAIHIGDQPYYEGLNKEFEQYDALLFELVAPEGQEVPTGEERRSGHPIGAMQNGMKNMLGLEHQLQGIDYTKPNFVHADMSPEEFNKAMKERGESFMQIFFHLMGQSIAQQSRMQAEGKSTDLSLLLAFFAKDRDLRLKQILAEQFEDTETMLVGLSGPDGSTLITGRNIVALNVLKSEIAAGKKKLGIFYGAGHLSDMDTRLKNNFKLKPVEVRWMTAWNLQPKD